MGLLKKLAALFSTPNVSTGSDPAYYVYVRCQACSEPIRVRVDLRNELTPDWNSQSSTSDQPEFYSVRKTAIGSSRCYRPVEIELRFDRQKRLESQRALGGTIISESEYQEAVSEWEAKKREQ